jgi:hypothetical protein
VAGAAPSGADGTICGAMTSAARSERTARLLVARLEAVARTATCLGPRHCEVVRLVEGVSVATARAVALELLAADDAAAIWAAARERHPELEAPEPAAAGGYAPYS